MQEFHIFFERQTNVQAIGTCKLSNNKPLVDIGRQTYMRPRFLNDYYGSPYMFSKPLGNITLYNFFYHSNAIFYVQIPLKTRSEVKLISAAH